MGENVTTRGVDLLALPAGTRLRLGAEAMIEVKGLRNPCRQLEEIQTGLMAAVLDRDADGGLIRKSGSDGGRYRRRRGPRRRRDRRSSAPEPPHEALDVV